MTMSFLSIGRAVRELTAGDGRGTDPSRRLESALGEPGLVGLVTEE
jgi:hypothetical protein